jgi:hypothetical protein
MLRLPKLVSSCGASPSGSLAFGEPHGFAGSHTASPGARHVAIRWSLIPAETARRYGPETTVSEWRKRTGLSRCGSHDRDIADPPYLGCGSLYAKHHPNHFVKLPPRRPSVVNRLQRPSHRNARRSGEGWHRHGYIARSCVSTSARSGP